MEPVTDYLECPNCGHESYQEFRPHTGEEFIMCPHCGYHREFSIVNISEQGTEGWFPQFDLKEFGGIGAYKVRHKGAIGHEVGSFTEPASRDEFIRLIDENREKVEHAQYSMLIDGILQTVVLIQGDLESYGEETTTTENC